MSNSGIYAIINRINGKYYIGSAVNLHHRWIQHKSALNKGYHDNKYLQKSWDKYGEDNFKFVILEEINKDKLIKHEQFWIEISNCCDDCKGYNLRPTANNQLNYKHSEETKLKIANTKRGKKWSVESRIKLSKTNTGRKHSDETKQKLSLALKGHTHTIITRAKISENQRKYNKYPCKDGWRCQCEKCRLTKKEYQKNWYKNKINNKELVV